MMNLSLEESLSILAGLKIAIDLTPMLPGGENGGAKLATLALIGALAELLPQTRFLLLTADSSHHELEELDIKNPNIERLCVYHTLIAAPATATVELSWKGKILDYLNATARKLLSASVKYQIKYLMHRTPRGKVSGSILRQTRADLLFCPFTAPFYADPTLPTVSIIYDLQYRYYPQFFSSQEMFQREEAFKTASKKADHLVTISDYVRQTVLETSGLSPDRVSTVLLGLFRSSEKDLNGTNQAENLLKYDLTPGEYLIYPANFWDHKNHEMLLTAFGMYRQGPAKHKVKLVCTGTPGFGANRFCDQVQRMGLGGSVIYPGFVKAEEYEALLHSAFALIFPSLYEGFGIPILEAMAAGIPVLCSLITSLPEVGGDAVLYFDPRKPAEICDAIRRLVSQPGLRDELIVKGRQRARLFQDSRRVAIEYSDVFARVVRSFNEARKPSLHGVYQDGWTADEIGIGFPAVQKGQTRSLSISLENPAWIRNPVKISPHFGKTSLSEVKVLKPGQSAEIELPLPNAGGLIEINISPTFSPQKLGVSPDARDLGLRCVRCEIVLASGKINLLKQEEIQVNEHH
jgi:glycosyltransferase involved in cell wall biosynthesis